MVCEHRNTTLIKCTTGSYTSTSMSNFWIRKTENEKSIHLAILQVISYRMYIHLSRLIETSSCQNGRTKITMGRFEARRIHNDFPAFCRTLVGCSFYGMAWEGMF